MTKRICWKWYKFLLDITNNFQFTLFFSSSNRSWGKREISFAEKSVILFRINGLYESWFHWEGKELICLVSSVIYFWNFCFDVKHYSIYDIFVTLIRYVCYSYNTIYLYPLLLQFKVNYGGCAGHLQLNSERHLSRETRTIGERMSLFDKVYSNRSNQISTTALSLWVSFKYLNNL